MLLLLVSFADADPTPAPPEAPDGERLVELASQGVRQPAGCWTMNGVAEDRWDAGLFGKGGRTWALSGTLRDGVWEGLTATVTSGDPVDEDEHRGSLFGRDPTTEKEGRKGSRVSVLEVLRDEVTMETVEPRGGGWRLTRSLKGGEAARNLLELDFDATLRPTVWRVLIVDPVRLQTQEGNQGRIVRMDARLAAAADGAPLSEALVGTFARWPFSVSVESRTTWSPATPCS